MRLSAKARKYFNSRPMMSDEARARLGWSHSIATRIQKAGGQMTYAPAGINAPPELRDVLSAFIPEMERFEQFASGDKSHMAEAMQYALPKET